MRFSCVYTDSTQSITGVSQCDALQIYFGQQLTLAQAQHDQWVMDYESCGLRHMESILLAIPSLLF